MSEWRWRRGEMVLSRVPGAVALDRAWECTMGRNWEAVTAWALLTMAESMIGGREWQKDKIDEPA